MKYTLLLLLSSLSFLSAKDKDYTQYVNPLMGSLSTVQFSSGNTYPAIARPWGMNFWTPQTGNMGTGWQYCYQDLRIKGFKQTHQPSPWIGDYGQFSIMPVTGEKEFDQERRASWYSHKGEIAQPHYYKVYLAEYDIVTEFSPTERAVMFKFTMPEHEKTSIIVDAFDSGSYVKVIPQENKVIGYSTKNNGGVTSNFKNYFVITFDKPFTSHAVVEENKWITDKSEIQNNHAGARLDFKTKKGEVIHAKIASSFISHEQAEQNLKELGQLTFDELVDQGKKSWNDTLGKIEIEGGNLDQLRTFYSCLYRCLLFPRKFYEINAQGETIHYSPFNGETLPGPLYTDTGFWDTFRALFPFLNLMYPSINQEIQEGLMNTYKESNFFPEWASPGHRDCMIGNNSASVLADAYLKGQKVAEPELLWEGLVHGTKNVSPAAQSTGRLGHEYYNELGYIPYDSGIRENTARTLEYAYNDWCIYQLGKALNKSDEELAPFKKRAFNYKNVFDSETSLMRGKMKDGAFMKPFSPLKWGDAFTEGNSLHYTWSVFHDPQGLIDLMGGAKPFIAKLDSIFEEPPFFDESYYGSVIHEIREMTVMNMGNYAHGNQPIQHMIYLYNYAQAPWKAQYWVREVMDKMYTPTPDGYCGDEDNGQTSAWYVFSALGFYPVCPGTDEYILGSPLFPKTTLHFENGKSLIIQAENNNQENVYVDKLQFQGKNHSQNYVKHQDLLKGGKMNFKMSSKPNLNRGTQVKDAPYSFSNALKSE